MGNDRGSSFLLQRSYTVHVTVVERLVSAEFSVLWETEVGSKVSDVQLVPTILAAVSAVKNAYEPFGSATDTLATKVLLGTVGCLPACDRFFIDGFKKSGNRYSYLNAPFVERILRFCTEHGSALRAEQSRIESAAGMRYPLMKLADMYFWQIGYESAASQTGTEPDDSPTDGATRGWAQIWAQSRARQCPIIKKGPKKFGSSGWIRTSNPPVNSRMLCH